MSLMVDSMAVFNTNDAETLLMYAFLSRKNQLKGNHVVQRMLIEDI